MTIDCQTYATKQAKNAPTQANHIVCFSLEIPKEAQSEPPLLRSRSRGLTLVGSYETGNSVAIMQLFSIDNKKHRQMRKNPRFPRMKIHAISYVSSTNVHAYTYSLLHNL